MTCHFKSRVSVSPGAWKCAGLLKTTIIEKIDKALIGEAIDNIKKHIEDLLREEHYGDMKQHYICMAKISAYKAAIREIELTCRLD